MLKQELRQLLRAKRASIDPDIQAAAAKQLCDNACQLAGFTDAQHIALYWPNDGEIDTGPLLQTILSQKKHCYLPVLLLDARQQLGFAAYTPQTPLVKNRYGIFEPDLNLSFMRNLEDLDIIFVPLVGFDTTGRRLGRGGGFYDATFANLKLIKTNKWPQLVGLAYDCQKIDEIPADSWDWRLTTVVTEAQVYNF